MADAKILSTVAGTRLSRNLQTIRQTQHPFLAAEPLMEHPVEVMLDKPEWLARELGEDASVDDRIYMAILDILAEQEALE